MDTEADNLRIEIAHFAALLAVLARYAPNADDLADLMRENTEIRRRLLAEVERRARLH